MPELKTNASLLKDLGYEYAYIPLKENELMGGQDEKSSFTHPKLPLGKRIDFVTKSALDDRNPATHQLIDILGTRYIANDLSTSNNHGNNVSLEHKYEPNDQLRMERFDELLRTEENYIRKLQPLVNTIVKPLKLSCAQSKHPVLKQYMCTNIFLNLEQILDVHQQFLKDLKTHRKDEYATLCSIHMRKMDRYRRYLLKVNEAHELHTTEYQKNQPYRSFIIKATTNPAFQKLRFENLLDEPWKRITAYAVLLEEIRNYTPLDHPDFPKLTSAFTQINTVASVRDDLPTMLATKSHDLYLSIRKAPCHLINQSRSLVTHMDAVEINAITGKVSRHVTLFLFCDKIMVASRSSHANGSDICGDGSRSGSSPLTNVMPKKKKGLDFKFCGWVGLQHIDLIQGPSDLPGAFMVRASSDFQDSITETDYEKYFKKGTRIFAYQAEPLRQTPVDFIKKKDAFVGAFYTSQAVKRQCGNQDATYLRLWHGHQLYNNVYDYETYTKTEIKNNVVAIFSEKGCEVDLSSLFSSNRSSPWVVVLVRPDSQGCELNIWSKIPLGSQQSSSDASEAYCKSLDFTTFFWNNVIECEQKLQYSSTYQLMNEGLHVQERRPRSRSRSRTSMTRSASITSISRFFGRSRSQSPFSSSATTISSSSTPHLVLSPSKSSPTKNQRDETTSTSQRRPRAHSLSGEPIPGETNSKPATRRRKLSFDATSIFKLDIKSSLTTGSSPTTAQQPKTIAQKCRPLSHQTHIQQMQNFNRQAPLSQNSKRPLLSKATPIPVPSTSTSPASMLHPIGLPSPNIYSPGQLSHQKANNALPSPPVPEEDGRQRLLMEKLDAMYHDMTGAGRVNTKDQQHQSPARYASDPLLISRPPSRTSSCSPVYVSSPTGPFGTSSSSSRSSNYTSTFSSHASQSSRSSISLEDMDLIKGYGPSPRLANLDMPTASTHQYIDDEIAQKVMKELANTQKTGSRKSLAPHYTSVMDEIAPLHQPLPSPTITNPTTPLRSTTVITSRTTMEKEQLQHQQAILDHVASTVHHCSYQVDSKWHFLLDKQRMLGDQVNRIANILPYDADKGMLSEMYRDTMDEVAHLFNKINTELEEISSTVNAYRQQLQQHPYNMSTSMIAPPAYATHDTDHLLKQKMKEVQLERDYWRRRASELSNQVNEYVLRQ